MMYPSQSPLYEDAVTFVGLGSTASDQDAIADGRVLRVSRDDPGQQSPRM